ncbi:Subtilisin-like protease 6 [Penicillium taxi]|uniref:Subtilisin-like protease 6 n=1 Tax=Penicillium taxi TaxID=168475 RepID=UPI0025450E0D|nr:Subtilisin-like protease 6 [Penicillium taxi]KAJ5901605.1 Subtilisin-like protease 6 [Penicillium taxi]
MAGLPEKRDNWGSYNSIYVITTKDGTSLAEFNSKVKGFDNGAGTESVNDAVNYQVYSTRLTAAQAAEMKKISCVRYVWEELDPDYDNDDDSEDERALPPFLEEPSFQRRGSGGSVSRKESASQLKLLSWNKPGKPGGDYLADSSLGKGTTIYVIDTGFNLAASDLASTNDRKVTHYVVDNEKTLPLDSSLTDASWRKPSDITDWGDHGTSVACVAGGLVYGVASKANLHLVKAKNAWKKPGSPLKVGRYQLAALSDAFIHILGHIRTNSKGKAVVNMSWGIESSQDVTNLLDMFIKNLEALDAVPVTSAGNTGDEDDSGLEKKVPTNLGTDDNTLITVGGTKSDGDLWSKTTPKRAGKAGSITVYAQGSKVTTQNGEGVVSSDHSGTSLASPAIAGLVAYYMGHDDFNHNFRTGRVATDVKDFVTRFAFQRVEKVKLAKNYPKPDKVLVGYNIARGAAQQCKVYKRDGFLTRRCELEDVTTDSPYLVDDCE